MSNNMGVAATPPGSRPSDGAASSGVSTVPASIPNAFDFGDLSKATPEQLGIIQTALHKLILAYSDAVRNAQARYERERALLADAMAEHVRISHFVARHGAEALEADSASGIEARRAATPQSGAVEGESAGPKGIAQPYR